MNRILIILAFTTFLLSQQAEITNVQVAQRTDGSKLVDITYDLTEDALFNNYTITVEVSLDNGNTWGTTFYVTGAVGTGQSAGIGNNIVWDLGEEYPNSFYENVKVRLTATGIIIEVPFAMVGVPAGDYTWGSDDEILNIDYDFEISKYPITNEEYTIFLIEALELGLINLIDIAGSWAVEGYYEGDEYHNPGIYVYNIVNMEGGSNPYKITWTETTFLVDEEYGTHPVVHVTWIGADAFARYYGLRLPDEYEWEKTARGDTGYDYPWGNTYDESNVNCGYQDDQWGGTSPVGFYNGQNYEGFQTTDSPSPYGAYDMAGNVWEWTKTWREVGGNIDDKTLRGGGSFAYNCNFIHSWDRTFAEIDEHEHHFGFRVARTL